MPAGAIQYTPSGRRASNTAAQLLGKEVGDALNEAVPLADGVAPMERDAD